MLSPERWSWLSTWPTTQPPPLSSSRLRHFDHVSGFRGISADLCCQSASQSQKMPKMPMTKGLSQNVAFPSPDNFPLQYFPIISATFPPSFKNVTWQIPLRFRFLHKNRKCKHLKYDWLNTCSLFVYKMKNVDECFLHKESLRYKLFTLSFPECAGYNGLRW